MEYLDSRSGIFLDSSDNDSALVYDVMILVCFELMMTLCTVLFCFGLASGLFNYPLGVLQFHLAAPYKIVGGCYKQPDRFADTPGKNSYVQALC